MAQGIGVRPGRREGRRGSRIPALLLFVVAGVVAVGLGFQFALSGLPSLQRRFDAQLENDAEVAALREANLRLERQHEVDIRAQEALIQSVRELSREAAELRRQLAVYQDVLASDSANAGVRVHEVRLIPGVAPRRYKYRLVLVQGVAASDAAKGRVTVQLQGRVGESARQVTAGEYDYSFRYFQALEGDLWVPEGMEPTELLISMKPAGRNKPLEQWIAWNEVVER